MLYGYMEHIGVAFYNLCGVDVYVLAYHANGLRFEPGQNSLDLEHLYL